MSTEEQRRRAAQREGYRGYRPRRLVHKESTFGGEPMDGIDYVSDDLHEQHVFLAMDADWTSSGDALAESGAEQISAAIQEAERWDCTRTDKYSGLKQLLAVRDKVQSVLTAMRADGDAVEWVDANLPILFGANETTGFDDAWWVSPPYWNPEDPRSFRGVFGVVASNSQRVHVLRAGYTPAVWLAEECDRAHGCAWDGPACLGYTRHLLTFTRGQYIVAMPTCHYCEAWLLDGAPTPGA